MSRSNMTWYRRQWLWQNAVRVPDLRSRQDQSLYLCIMQKFLYFRWNRLVVKRKTAKIRSKRATTKVEICSLRLIFFSKRFWKLPLTISPAHFKVQLPLIYFANVVSTSNCRVFISLIWFQRPPAACSFRPCGFQRPTASHFFRLCRLNNPLKTRTSINLTATRLESPAQSSSWRQALCFDAKFHFKQIGETV